MSRAIHVDLLAVPNDYKAYLLDAYGVFWGGGAVGILPGAKEAIESLVKQGKVVGILSNSTQLTSKEEAKLERHGLEKGKHYHFLLTSGQATAHLLADDALPFPTPRKVACLSGAKHPQFASPTHLFEGSSYSLTQNPQDADFIYIDIPHLEGEDQVDPKKFEEVCQALTDYGLPLLCANPDPFAQEGKPPRFVVRQGMIAQMCEARGAQVFYVGKPYPYIYSLVTELFKQQDIHSFSNVLMVGDNPNTDIMGANLNGISSALILQTGVAADQMKQTYAGKIEPFIQSLTAEQTPTHYINRLGAACASQP